MLFKEKQQWNTTVPNKAFAQSKTSLHSRTDCNATLTLSHQHSRNILLPATRAVSLCFTEFSHARAQGSGRQVVCPSHQAEEEKPECHAASEVWAPTAWQVL